MSFGRKGLQPGQVAPQPATGFGRAAKPSAASAPAAPSVDEEMAAKRAAFIASERARKMEETSSGSLPDANGEYASDPMAHLRNDARPAAPLSPQERSTASAMATPEQQLDMQRAARARSGSSSAFVFGEPGGRSVGLAYVLWFILGQLSIHRFYCGQAESAWFQLSLFIGSLVTIFVFPPIGLIGFVGWAVWIVADLFLIPGMMRRFKAAHAYTGVFS